MPELPEVETVCRGLAKVLTGQKILRVLARRPDLRRPLPERLAERLKGRKITHIGRRAKYILLTLDTNETLLIHLGMSGRLIINHEPVVPAKHDHLVFEFTNGVHVHFNDPRRFGLCELIPAKELFTHPLLNHLGIEPLEQELTSGFLEAKLKGKATTIKAALLDQRLVVGIGNIYACEALFHAGISPRRRAGALKKEEITRLVPAIRKVLRAAIAAGGSSLRDYVQPDGELGYFQHKFAVYGRTGRACPGCTCETDKTGGIRRIAQAGRSSFFCPIKQK